MTFWTRRNFAQSLTASAAGLLALASPRMARGQSGQIGQPSELDLPQLRYDGVWNPRPQVMNELAAEVRLRSRLETKAITSSMGLEATTLFDTPFLYMAGQGRFPKLDEKSLNRLRRFLDLGGLLVIDDADGGAGFEFREQAQQTISALLGGAKFAPLRDEHVLFRSFYIIPSPMGRTAHADHVLGIHEGGRIKVLLFPNDLGGALARQVDGSYLYPCQPGGEVQREWAIRFGVNLVLYATCTDYKADPAHVETLLRRRVWR
jgi:hypothetical protein